MAGVLVVFDFDRTIIDSDSDNLVVTEMGLTPLFKQLRSSTPWNALMVNFTSKLFDFASFISKYFRVSFDSLRLAKSPYWGLREYVNLLSC